MREALADSYSAAGRPSIDPELMLRMLLVGYLFGIRSERRLCQEVHLNLVYRWFCHLDLGDAVPDHSTFSKNRHGCFRERDLSASVRMVMNAAMASASSPESGRRAGGRAGAVTKVGVSASAIGKAVVRLEARLAVRLFHRSTRSLTLTPEGSLFLDRCSPSSARSRRPNWSCRRPVRRHAGACASSLPLIGMQMMPAVMAFMRAYPEIELDLDFTDRLVDVIDEGFDAVIRTGEARDNRLMMRRAGAFSHRIVGSSDYLTTHGTPSTPQDLIGHACHHHKYPSTGRLERWSLTKDGADFGLGLPVTSVASTLEPQICLAEEGFGLACLPQFAIRAQLPRGSLVSVLKDHLREVGAFHILWPASRHPSPKVSAFVSFMADNLLREPQAVPCRSAAVA